MNTGKTLFLKVAVILIGIPVFALCVFLLFWIAKETLESGSGPVYYLYPILTVMLLSAIPFFMALGESFKLLGYIDSGVAFSDASVHALRKIKRCAIAIGGLYVLAMPFFFIMGDLDDAPGVILMGTIPIFASTVIAVFSGVLQMLLKEAILMKSENDLTI